MFELFVSEGENRDFLQDLQFLRVIDIKKEKFPELLLTIRKNNIEITLLYWGNL